MRELLVHPQIHRFETVAAFTEAFQLQADDLLFTEKFLHQRFFQALALPCQVVCRDEFGLGEPSDEMIDRILEAMESRSSKRIVAVGGGTVIDIAKILALKDARPSLGLFKQEKPFIKDKELIIIPTTCGTGSEMTNLSIAAIVSLETKLGVGNDAMYADHAVLIPELAKGLPYSTYIFSAVDALVHAMESYVSPKANAYTEMMSLRASEIILDSFVVLAQEGEARKADFADALLTASNIAGIAFGNAGVGPVHALAYPLGANFHVPHGEANYQFFSEVFNLYCQERSDEKLSVLARMICCRLQRMGVSCAESDAFSMLDEAILKKLQPLKQLREYGMTEENIDSMAQSVIDNQQRLLVNSHIPFTLEHAKRMYRNRF